MALEPPKYLPEDILRAILYNLPVKSLNQCRCVCKTWYHTTSLSFGYYDDDFKVIVIALLVYTTATYIPTMWRVFCYSMKIIWILSCFLNLQFEVPDIVQDNPINFLAMAEGKQKETTSNVRDLILFSLINTERLGSDLYFFSFQTIIVIL